MSETVAPVQSSAKSRMRRGLKIFGPRALGGGS
jgi:hypothetical protein